MKIKKGDKVKILLGKDRGKEGKVEMVLGKEKKVFIGGANMYKRHVKKHKDMQGRILDIPKPMNISNIALICPNCSKVTRVGYKRLPSSEVKSESTDKLRICKKCKKEIK